MGKTVSSGIVRATDLYHNLNAELKLVSDLKRKIDDIGLFGVPVGWLNEKMGYDNNGVVKAGLIKRRLTKYHRNVLCDSCLWHVGSLEELDGNYYVISVNMVNEDSSYKLKNELRRCKLSIQSMSKGEKLAYCWLSDNNWNPIKVRPTRIYGKVKACCGIPDFVCSNSRWVEVKEVKSANINITQLTYWEQLVNQGDSVFLMFSNIKKNLVSIPLNVSKSFIIDIEWTPAEMSEVCA